MKNNANMMWYLARLSEIRLWLTLLKIEGSIPAVPFTLY